MKIIVCAFVPNKWLFARNQLVRREFFVVLPARTLDAQRNLLLLVSKLHGSHVRNHAAQQSWRTVSFFHDAKKQVACNFCQRSRSSLEIPRLETENLSAPRVVIPPTVSHVSLTI